MATDRFTRVSPSVYLVRDTCNVYVIRSGSTAITIDFGSGLVLDLLPALGITDVTDVLMTHHHRDQGQGLHRAYDHGARIWVPASERHLFDDINNYWQARVLDNNYDLRQDRFSILEDVPIHGVVPEYRTMRFGAVCLEVFPTPGHTLGSTTYIGQIDGSRVAFTGDLIYGPGKVWSLSAMQWSFTGLEGAAASNMSLELLSERPLDVLLPSHGAPMHQPHTAMADTARELTRLVHFNQVRDINHPFEFQGDKPWDLKAWIDEPFIELSPHLLMNRTSFATSYVLLSDAGTALFLDFGLDTVAGLPTGTDRSSRRPSLTSVRALKRIYGIDRIEVAIPTHYHDDHVAGFNLLREVEGTEIWTSDLIAPVLERPRHYDLPCLWYDPIGVDRTLLHGKSVSWREYSLTLHHLPGHTFYADAIAFETDGVKVLASGDQQGGVEGGPNVLNFQYRNGFRIDDFTRSAELYQGIQPDLMISGHWSPRRGDVSYLAALLDRGQELADIHRSLLPLDDLDFGAGGTVAHISPYRVSVRGGESIDVFVEVVNPFPWRWRLKCSWSSLRYGKQCPRGRRRWQRANAKPSNFGYQFPTVREFAVHGLPLL